MAEEVSGLSPGAVLAESYPFRVPPPPMASGLRGWAQLVPGCLPSWSAWTLARGYKVDSVWRGALSPQLCLWAGAAALGAADASQVRDPGPASLGLATC